MMKSKYNDLSNKQLTNKKTTLLAKITEHPILSQILFSLEALSYGMVAYYLAYFAISPIPYQFLLGCLALASLFLLGIRESKRNHFVPYALLVACALSLMMNAR